MVAIVGLRPPHPFLAARTPAFFRPERRWQIDLDQSACRRKGPYVNAAGLGSPAQLELGVRLACERAPCPNL